MINCDWCVHKTNCEQYKKTFICVQYGYVIKKGDEYFIKYPFEHNRLEFIGTIYSGHVVESIPTDGSGPASPVPDT